MVAADSAEEVETTAGAGMLVELLFDHDSIAGTEAGSDQGGGGSLSKCQYGNGSLGKATGSIAEYNTTRRRTRPEHSVAGRGVGVGTGGTLGLAADQRRFSDAGRAGVLV